MSAQAHLIASLSRDVSQSGIAIIKLYGVDDGCSFSSEEILRLFSDNVPGPNAGAIWDAALSWLSERPEDPKESYLMAIVCCRVLAGAIELGQEEVCLRGVPELLAIFTSSICKMDCENCRLALAWLSEARLGMVGLCNESFVQMSEMLISLHFAAGLANRAIAVEKNDLSHLIEFADKNWILSHDFLGFERSGPVWNDCVVKMMSERSPTSIALKAFYDRWIKSPPHD